MATEKRLIDANDIDYENILCSQSQLHWLNAIIEKQPTVDAVEVVHGQWKYYTESQLLRAHYRCTNCKHPRYEHYAHTDFKFCPNCGAKMDGGADNG